jgi:glutathione S-transferase
MAMDQLGLAAPGTADKIRLYDHYLHKMEATLVDSDWLVGTNFTMADIAITPYVNRISALSMEDLWRKGRLPRVERWFRGRLRRVDAP